MWQLPQVWTTALGFGGAGDIVFMKQILADIPWWELEGKPEMIKEINPAGEVLAAAADDARFVIVYSSNLKQIVLEFPYNDEYTYLRFDLRTHDRKEGILVSSDGRISRHTLDCTRDTVFIFKRSAD